MPFRAVFVGILLAASVAIAPALASTQPPAAVIAAALALFGTETQAQKHCPGDVVVWLNIPTHIYHEKGMRWYGRTKHGAYVCKKEADAAGDRDTHNGQ